MTETAIHDQFGIEIEYLPPSELRRLFTPAVVPLYWREVRVPSHDAIVWTYEPPFGRRFKVLISAAREQDKRIWAHISLSKWAPGGTSTEEPSWSDIRDVKRLFVGGQRKAIVVLPEDRSYVNKAEVHHMWVCLDDDPLPDFRRGVGSI